MLQMKDLDDDGTNTVRLRCFPIHPINIRRRSMTVPCFFAVEKMNYFSAVGP